MLFYYDLFGIQVPVIIIMLLFIMLYYFLCFFAILRFMENTQRDIGLRISEILEKLGMSRDDLGRHLDVRVGAVGKYIRGDSDPGAIRLAKIAEIGNVTLDWLITGKEPPAAEKPAGEEQALAYAVRNPGILASVVDGMVKEELEKYEGKRKHLLEDDERQLLENYKNASEEMREEAFGLLERSARRSREIAGGGLGSAGNDSRSR